MWLLTAGSKSVRGAHFRCYFLWRTPPVAEYRGAAGFGAHCMRTPAPRRVLQRQRIGRSLWKRAPIALVLHRIIINSGEKQGCNQYARRVDESADRELRTPNSEDR
jgi:hypothetical protein